MNETEQSILDDAIMKMRQRLDQIGAIKANLEKEEKDINSKLEALN